ncbi:hypothetical protein [Actinomyces sp. oral taxon 448]|jgi:putative lipoprotein|uniref:hypothetical protein n=1 Tax=Actinomyces sp. oral taxon 448 TaxID=712124 RepID=UPI0002EA212D|nr:hypothetical protein [Actinomyces sp. oral taxon 448]
MHTKNQSRKLVVSAVTAAAAALWVGGLTGCSSMGDKTDADYVSVCKDPATGQRVDDEKCPQDRNKSVVSGPYWVYVPTSGSRSVSAPGVGEKVPSDYTDSKPSSDRVTTAGRSGGSFSKGSDTSHGGFGSGSKGGSGS